MSQEKDRQPERSYEDIVAEKERLQQENERLQKENARLGRRVKELEKKLDQLRSALEEAQRWQKRQAAPFSRGEPKAAPKRPGRPVGHPAAHRERPARVDRVVEVPLDVDQCPACAGPLGEPTIQTQYQVDIPRVEPYVTQFNIEVAGCTACGQRVQGRHAEQTSDALGAAAVQIGPHALALATEMKHRLGVSYGKLRSFFSGTFQMVIGRATFARADQRIGKKLAPTYEVLKIECTCLPFLGWTVKRRIVTCGDLKFNHPLLSYI